MSITTNGVGHIISTIEDLLFLLESQHPLSISTDRDGKDNVFIKVTFYLKNGKSEIQIHNYGGCCSYFDFNGENLESIDFNENSLTDTSGSFHKALKTLIVFDRQNATQEVKSANNLIDRASFGLAEVN